MPVTTLCEMCLGEGKIEVSYAAHVSSGQIVDEVIVSTYCIECGGTGEIEL